MEGVPHTFCDKGPKSLTPLLGMWYYWMWLALILRASLMPEIYETVSKHIIANRINHKKTCVVHILYTISECDHVCTVDQDMHICGQYKYSCTYVYAE